MKPNLPRSFHSLSKHEQQAIEKALQDAMDREICDTQIIWIKMACIILHDLGFTSDDAMMFIGNWRRMYAYNSRLPDQAAQDAWLNKHLSEIFGEGGFPEEYVQNFRNIGR